MPSHGKRHNLFLEFSSGRVVRARRCAGKTVQRYSMDYSVEPN